MKTDRFKDAPWFENVKKKPIIIGGAGGLGSWLALWLSRTGCEKIAIYDPDTFEEHNLGGQCCFESHIGSKKVDAVKDVCSKMGVTLPYTFSVFYEKQPRKAAFMFSCFDNMAARKIFFEAWKATPSKELFIDARLEAEHSFVFTVINDEEIISKYEETLLSDDEIPDAPCTFKQTSPVAALTTAKMWQAFVNYCSGNPRGLNFKETYSGPLAMTTVEGKYSTTKAIRDV
jgi:hypothetical protein